MSNIIDIITNKFRRVDISEASTSSTASSSDISSTSNMNTWQLISKLRDVSDNNKFRYQEYDIMENEVVIQSALELYSDDATQLDSTNSKVVIVEAKDKQLASDLDTFLTNIIKIDSRIWQWAYDLCKYGDFYLEIHSDKDESTDEDIIRDDAEWTEAVKSFTVEEIDDPSTILDLWNLGERVNFAEEVVRNSSGHQATIDLKIKDPSSYIHFFINNTSKSDIIEIPIEGEYETNPTNGVSIPKVRRYKVVRGRSMIEGVRSIYRVLQLLEDSLLAARVAKAEFIRVYNIEVGEDTPGKTTETINRVKDLFDAKSVYDTSTGRYKSQKELKVAGDPIFNPVRNGKGAVNYEDIGGNFEVSNILDIDYFNNKLFSGLKIPKAYLGFEESLPGGLGNDTLIRLDIRYSRSVKRVIVALVAGIKDLCVEWCKSNGREINSTDFEIHIAAPSSSEELSRLSELDLRVSTIDRISSSIQGAVGDYVNMPTILAELYDAYLPTSKIKDVIVKELESAKVLYDARLKLTSATNDSEIKSLESTDESY